MIRANGAEIRVVPESQLWTLEEPHRSRIARGLAWAANTKPEETKIATLVRGRKKAAGRSRAHRG
jgi:hypothetical protein